MLNLLIVLLAVRFVESVIVFLAAAVRLFIRAFAPVTCKGSGAKAYQDGGYTATRHLLDRMLIDTS